MHVDGKGVHPALIRNCIKASWNRTTGRMHQNIKAAQIFDDLVDAVAARGGIGYIC
jgi:hypothetical protein